MEEELYLSNIYPEEGRREGAPLFYPNATLSEIEKVMCHPEVSWNCLIHPHGGYQEDLKYANVAEPLE
jgi:hypothetical protein